MFCLMSLGMVQCFGPISQSLHRKDMDGWFFRADRLGRIYCAAYKDLEVDGWGLGNPYHVWIERFVRIIGPHSLAIHD